MILVFHFFLKNLFFFKVENVRGYKIEAPICFTIFFIIFSNESTHLWNQALLLSPLANQRVYETAHILVIIIVAQIIIFTE